MSEQVEHGTTDPVGERGEVSAAQPAKGTVSGQAEPSGSETASESGLAAQRGLAGAPRSPADPPSAGAGAASAGSGLGSRSKRGEGTLRPIEVLHGVELEVTVELGRVRMLLKDLLNVHVGSLIELDRPAGSPVDVLVNGVPVARGEVVVVDDEFAVRITELVEEPPIAAHG
jgi:flagellar motor switch protein FliN/FliY